MGSIVSLVKPWRAWLLGAGLLALSCNPNILLSAGNLQIRPNPARDGEPVSFVFNLVLVPERAFSVVAMIDGTEHTSVTRIAASDGPFEFFVGDAADLIATYGLGTHVARVEVRVENPNRTASTAEVVFELQPAATPSIVQAPVTGPD